VQICRRVWSENLDPPVFDSSTARTVANQSTIERHLASASVRSSCSRVCRSLYTASSGAVVTVGEFGGADYTNVPDLTQLNSTGADVAGAIIDFVVRSQLVESCHTRLRCPYRGPRAVQRPSHRARWLARASVAASALSSPIAAVSPASYSVHARRLGHSKPVVTVHNTSLSLCGSQVTSTSATSGQ